MGRQLRPVQFSDLVAFVDREARILANSFFGKILDTIRSAPGQRFSGGKTFRFKNLRLLANVGDSEGPTNETVPQGVKDPSQLAYGEQRPHTRKIQPSGIDQGGEGRISNIPWCIASVYIIKLRNACDPISSTWTWQLNNGGKRLILPIKPSVPLLRRSNCDFRFTLPDLSLVKSKREFWPPMISYYDYTAVQANVLWS